MKRLTWFFKKPPYLWEDRPTVRQKKQRKYDIRFIWFAWAVLIILFLGLGIYAGHKVTAANKDTEIMDVRAQLETANASLADVNIEVEQGRVPADHWLMIASWYGAAYHGRRAADGSIYDMGGDTVAHRTLPFGTTLLIENTKNGRLALAKVTDRGPFIGARELDVSRAIAERLGMIDDGLAVVKVWILEGRASEGD